MARYQRVPDLVSWLALEDFHEYTCGVEEGVCSEQQVEQEACGFARAEDTKELERY